MSCQFLLTKGWVCKTVEYLDTDIFFFTYNNLNLI